MHTRIQASREGFEFSIKAPAHKLDLEHDAQDHATLYMCSMGANTIREQRHASRQAVPAGQLLKPHATPAGGSNRCRVPAPTKECFAATARPQREQTTLERDVPHVQQ